MRRRHVLDDSSAPGPVTGVINRLTLEQLNVSRQSKFYTSPRYVATQRGDEWSRWNSPCVPKKELAAEAEGRAHEGGDGRHKLASGWLGLVSQMVVHAEEKL